jgi:hypothetical protein
VKATTRRSVVVVGVAASLLLALLFWVRGRHGVILEGTYQTSFEESAFFVNGDCSRKPIWWQWPNGLDADLQEQRRALGNPEAMHVKVRANLSSIGAYGHLGAYRREVDPIILISADATSRCRWSWGAFPAR